MPDSIIINTKDLDQEAIAAIQERFGMDVELTIHADTLTERSLLEDAEGWALIDLLNWQENNTEEETTAPLIARLREFPIGHIYRFNDWLAKKLYLLDTPAHAKAYLQGEEYLSVDDFLYARCAVVANGEEVYETILANPEEMPSEVTFEPLLYLAYRAYEAKTGDKMVYTPLYNYETYGNIPAWGDGE